MEQQFIYDLKFQRSLIKLLCTNMSFAQNVGILLSEDYFESQPLRTILTIATESINTYGREIEYSDFNIKIDEYVNEKGFSKEALNLLRDELKLIYAINDIKENFLSDVSLQWIRRQKLKQAFQTGIDILKKDGDYEQILKLMDSAISIGSGMNEGYSFNDLYNLPQQYKKFYDPSKLIKTGFHTYDRALDGGMGPGEVHILAGPAKSGKSTLGPNFAITPLLTGKAVFHISLEISALAVLKKYAARITGLSNKTIFDDNSSYEEKISRFQKYGCRLFVNFWPLGSITTLEIRSWISRIRSKQGVSPDLIIIDYDDCLRSTNDKVGNDQMYLDAGNVYTDLKQLAEYFKCPILTFAQTTRNSWEKYKNKELISCYDIAHSAKKIHLCDSITTINFTPGENEGILYVDLVRRGESYIPIPVRRDYDKSLLEENPNKKF